MLKITVVGVGKLKEKYWHHAVQEYNKRLGGYCHLTVKEVADEKAAEKLSPIEEQQVKTKEWQRISCYIPAGAYLVALDIRGEAPDSLALAARLDQLALWGQSHIVFIIGGSLGLAEEAIQKANWRLSFSRLTFPHQMMRVILLEQIYRAFKINRGEPYHK